MMRWIAGVTASVLLVAAVPPTTGLAGGGDMGESSGCASDIDCSLNGKCTAGACVCDRPWVGDACGQLAFKPVVMPQGYGMTPNKTTWGGNILAERDGKRFHMYVSAMTNGCGLGHWSSNSRIEHVKHIW